MKKKLAIALGFILLALVVTALVVVMLPPAEPPLRVGMTVDEATQITGVDFLLIPEGSSFSPAFYVSGYNTESDWLGNRLYVDLRFCGEEQGWTIVQIDTKRLPRSRPPWLDRAMKRAGW